MPVIKRNQSESRIFEILILHDIKTNFVTFLTDFRKVKFINSIVFLLFVTLELLTGGTDFDDLKFAFDVCETNG